MKDDLLGQRRGAAAVLAAAQRLEVVAAHPDDGDVWAAEAGEPRVTVIVGRTGLAADVETLHAGRLAGALLAIEPEQIAHHRAGLGLDHLGGDGVGLRLGANVGTMSYSRQRNLIPF